MNDNQKTVELSQEKSNDKIMVKNLVKKYGKCIVVNDISFLIKKGEIFGINDPNDASKTTIIVCISGLRETTSDSYKMKFYRVK